jgi:hypothetical protein
MSRKKRSWEEKLNDAKDLPRTITMPEKLMKRWGRGKMLIPSPVEVNAVMQQVRKGRLITIDLVRTFLAAKHRVGATCPMTTGIFAWIAAHAAEEAREKGRKRITPYWRTLKTGGELNAKYPGGVEDLKAKLENEGHSIEQRGKRFFVSDFEPKLARLQP